MNQDVTQLAWGTDFTGDIEAFLRHLQIDAQAIEVRLIREGERTWIAINTGPIGSKQEMKDYEPKRASDSGSR